MKYKYYYPISKYEFNTDPLMILSKYYISPLILSIDYISWVSQIQILISNIPSYIKASNAKIMMTFNIKSNSFGFGYTWSYGVFIEQPEGNAKIFFCCHHLMLDISKPPLCLCQKITPWNIWNRFDCITTFSAQNV